MKRIAVLTSGGDSPGMNACLRAIAKVAASKGLQVLGVCDGYEGLIDGRFRELTWVDDTGQLAADPELEFFGGLGGTLIGSARSARFFEAAGRAQAAKHLADVDGLIVIGGNGSLMGAHRLVQEHGVRVIGVPASIDNDIGCTSLAIGVDSALNTIVEACDRISDTARAHHRAFVVEVMGRYCGYLAMASAVAAAAEGVLFREQGRSDEQLIEAVANVIRRAFAGHAKKRVLIIKSEGVEMPCTRLVREVARALAPTMPKLEMRATVLGHVVRGGNPSYHDRMLAGRFGFAAVNALLEGATDEMVAWIPPDPKHGVPTLDPSVFRFGLDQVLRETQALIDGTSPVTRWRVQMMQAVEGVLAL